MRTGAEYADGRKRVYDAIVEKLDDDNNILKIFYEFKSWGELPPDEFVDQFLKDLANLEITDLSMNLKWVFDSTKLAPMTKTEFLDEMRMIIDDLPIDKLNGLSEKFGFDPNQGIKLRDFIKSKVSEIFKMIPDVD